MSMLLGGQVPSYLLAVPYIGLCKVTDVDKLTLLANSTSV